MIHVLHGDKQVESLKEIDLIKEKYKPGEKIDLDGKKISPTDLIVATESQSLFDSKRLVIVREYLSRYKKGDIKELKSQIDKIPSSSEIIFWEPQEIGKNILSVLPKNADIAVFNADKLIFKLVESLGRLPAKEILYLYQDCLKLESAEFIFSMLVRQIRLLLQIKNGVVPKGMQPWQISRLRSQSEKFDQVRLSQFYRQLLFTDQSIKYGTNGLTLDKMLAQLVLS